MRVQSSWTIPWWHQILLTCQNHWTEWFTSSCLLHCPFPTHSCSILYLNLIWIRGLFSPLACTWRQIATSLPYLSPQFSHSHPLCSSIHSLQPQALFVLVIIRVSVLRGALSANRPGSGKYEQCCSEIRNMTVIIQQFRQLLQHRQLVQPCPRVQGTRAHVAGVVWDYSKKS